MSAALHHALLGLSIAALAAAGLRLASLAAPDGLERGLAALTLVAAAAIVQALGLGLVGLGSDPVALGLASLATWAVARAALPQPGLRLTTELARGATRLPLTERLALGALGGAAIAYTAWLLRYPAIGFDASIYHFAEVAAWVREGSPGSVEYVSHAFPVGHYPVSGEVLAAWAAGIARSFAVLSLWAPALFVTLGLASWLGLRELGAGRRLRVLAIVALLSSPWLVRELAEPLTDLASLAWLATCAALCAAARRRPALVVPAVVAAGLAVGTKTTALVPLVAVLAATAVALRGRLRPLAPWLAGAAALAVAAGGYWYLRNLVEHGSPSWPFLTTPWGDPAPAFVELLDVRFAERPLDTLDGRTGRYAEFLAGGLGNSGAALVAPLLARTRQVALSAGVTALALLAWAMAPVTGLTRSPLVDPPDVWILSTTRYLLPVIACSIVTLVLAARVNRPGRALAVAALAVSAAWSLAEDAALGFPHLPSAATLVAGAGLGTVLAAVATWAGPRLPRRACRRRPWRSRRRPRSAPRTGGAGLPRAARRGDRVGALAGRRLTEWFTSQPGFDGEGRRVTFVGRFVAAELAGAHFQHKLELLPPDAGCGLVRRRARQGWVVIAGPEVGRGVLGIGPLPATRCRPAARALYDDGQLRIYAARPWPPYAHDAGLHPRAGARPARGGHRPDRRLLPAVGRVRLPLPRRPSGPRGALPHHDLRRPRRDRGPGAAAADPGARRRRVGVRPPTYPYLLAAVTRSPGDSYTAGRLANALLGVMAAGLVFLIARRLWDDRAALAAAAVSAVAPPLVYLSVALMSEALFVVLELAAVLALLCWRDDRRLRFVLVAGVLCGLRALTTGERPGGRVGRARRA